MWPFRTRTSEERERAEYLASKTEFMQKVIEQLRDLDQRFKVIEREHEDLHRAYRRLRASNAQEAREQPARPRQRPEPANDGDGENVRPLTKAELRAKFLTPGF